MFRCGFCHELFEEPETRYFREYLGPGLGYMDESLNVCPFCGEDDMEDLDEEELSLLEEEGVEIA